MSDVPPFGERFVIDDAGFEFHDEQATSLESTLKLFLDLLDYAQDTKRGVVRWSEIWYVVAASGQALVDLLFTPSEIDRDVRLLCGSRLHKIQCWDDSLNPPSSVRCDGTDLPLAPGIGLCLLAAHQRHGVACLTTNQARRRGALDVASPNTSTGTVTFLVEPADGPAFWRSTVELEDLDAGQFASVSHLAYPRLRFAPDIWVQVRRFEGAFRDLRHQLARDLSGLNDHVLDVWRDHVEPNRIAAEMGSRAGVDCSRDSPKTHRNAEAMAERRVEFDGKPVICEWHTKLERNRNRIHFAVLGGEIFVGVFAAHLRT
jgi:hypothetical protein